MMKIFVPLLVTMILISAPLRAADSDYVILSESQVPRMFDQCSRGMPDRGEGTWLPRASDIEFVEKGLLSQLELRGPNAERHLQGRIRQYVGIVRGGQRFIYGNFFPDNMKIFPGWKVAVLITCDGGEHNFGVEFNAKTGVISHLDFNGM